MNVNRWIMPGLMLALLLFVAKAGPQNPLDAQEKAPRANPNPFMGKILLIYERTGTAGYHLVIQNAELIEIGGERCLVGKAIPGLDWLSDLKVTIALDNVASIVEFDDLATYQRRIENKAQ